METTNVLLKDNRGQVQLLTAGIMAGHMEISVKGNLLTVYHTEVDPLYEGRGFAKLLLKKLVEYARENQLKIVPLCPFVHLQFRRNPDLYRDVWAS